MAKPEIIVNGGTAGAMTSVSASSAWTATLDSVDGVRQVAWSVSSTDETTTAASYTLVQSGSVGQNVASTSQGQGTALILQAIVNAGVNAATGQADPTNTTAKVKIVVPLADGGIVGCAGEEYESDATYGATGIINSGIRKAAVLSPSGVAVKIVRAATAAALPANTRTANVLTADINGAIGTVGGVALAAGDYFVVQNEGGGASHVNNGAYYLSQQGTGSLPWKATRAAYFDDSAELIAMTTFRIQEGTYAGKERYLVTSGATINVTALEFAAYGYAPNDAAYLTVGAVSDLSAERNISAVTSTLDFASTTTIPLQASRTDSATAALVDVETVSALSSGSAAAGFGPALKFLGEVSGGGAENYGRVGFAATDLTGGSEDTKAVLQARTAGAALATVAEFSGTAATIAALAGSGSAGVEVDGSGNLTRGAGGGASTSAKYVTDAAATVNANDVPLQAMTGTLEFKSTARPVGFAHEVAAAGTTELVRHRRTITAAAAGLTGTGGYDSWWIPDGAGTEVEAFRLNARWNQVVGPYAEVALSFNSNGSLTERIVFSPAGAITTPGIITGANFVGVSLDRATAGALTLGGTNATSVAGSGLPFTGILSIDNSGAGLTIGANTTSQTFGNAGTTATFAGANVLTQQTTLSALGTGIVHSSSGGVLSSSAVVNADVDAAAAIAGTKIAPAFGAQSISQTGATSITAGSVGFIGAVLDNSGGTLTVGGNTTGQTFGKASTTFALLGAATVAETLGITGATTHSAAVTINIPSLTTTSTDGFVLAESTASDAVNTVRYSPRARWSGRTWIGGADKTMNVIAELRPRTSTNLDLYFRHDTGAGTYSDFFFITTATATGFWQAACCPTFESQSGGSGFRFANGSQGGMAMDGSGNIQIKSSGTPRVDLFSTIGTGTATDGIRSWNDAGTRTAGYIHTFGYGSGGTFTQKAGVAYDGTWNGPVVRHTASKNSDYTAVLHELVEYTPAGGTFTVTTPTPASGITGQLLVTKNIGSSGIPLSITTPSGNIDNAATIKVAGGYACDTMMSDGSNGWLRIAALRPWNFTATKTSAYTAAIGEVVKCDPSGGTFAVTLPAVPTTNTLREVDIIIKNITSSTTTITITPDGSDTIDGAASATITTARGVVKLLGIAGGTDWIVL